MKPVPKVVLQDRDVLIGSRLNYHGPMTSHQLRNYDDEPTQRGFQMRLTDLHKGGYIEKPVRRIKSFIPRSIDPEVYANTPLMDEHLKKKGLLIRSSQALSRNNLAHERFLAAVTSSIELCCLDKDWKYRFEFQLISKAPSFSRLMPCHIEYLGQVRGKHGWENKPLKSDEALMPDAYFGIDNGRLTAYFLEIDRKTEPIWRTDLDEEAWRPKLLKYIKIMDSGYYKTHLGLASNTPALCLFVFNNLHRMEAVQQELLNLTNGKGRPYMLFQTWSEFDDPTFIPKEVNDQFIKDAWYRVGHDTSGKDHAPMLLV